MELMKDHEALMEEVRLREDQKDAELEKELAEEEMKGAD